MKRLIIAAALAMVLPAFAAEESSKAVTQPQPAEQAAPAKEKAAKPAKEQLATEGVTEQVTRAKEKAAAKPAKGGAKAEERNTLRFQDWVHDEDNEDKY